MHDEGAWRRGIRDAWRDITSHPVPFIALAVLGAAVGSLVPDDANAVVAGLTGFAALAAICVAWTIYSVPRALWRQRGEARAELEMLRDAQSSYDVVAQDVRSLPPPNGMVHLHLRNDGCGGQFAATLEAIDGPTDPLAVPGAYLPWVTSVGTIAEEIPTGDQRVIGLGRLVVERDRVGHREWTAGVRFVLVDEHGRDVGREHRLIRGTPLVVQVRLTARGSPVVPFTRIYRVSAHWPDGTDDGVQLSLLPD